MPTAARTDTDRIDAARTDFALSPLERALIRLLARDYTLEEAAAALGLTAAAAQQTLRELQERCEVFSLPRLLTLAILRSWV